MMTDEAKVAALIVAILMTIQGNRDLAFEKAEEIVKRAKRDWPTPKPESTGPM